MFAEFTPRAAPREGPWPAPGIVAEPAGSGDLERIAQLSAERQGQPVAEAVESLRRWREAPGERALLVAREGTGLILGFGKVGWWAPSQVDPESDLPDGFYLGGVVVDPPSRRRGIGSVLTYDRLDWAADHAEFAYYVASLANEASIEMHRRIGFGEIERGVRGPGLRFTGGVGALYRIQLG